MFYVDVYASVNKDTFPFPILYARFFSFLTAPPVPARWTEVLRVGVLALISLGGKVSVLHREVPTS